LSGCDLAGILTTCKKYVEFLKVLAVEKGRNGSRTTRLSELEDSHWLQGLGM
jgi:hypothetical protein